MGGGGVHLWALVLKLVLNTFQQLEPVWGQDLWTWQKECNSQARILQVDGTLVKAGHQWFDSSPRRAKMP